MTDFVRPEVKPRQVRDASDALRGDLHYCPEAVEIFRVAHNWRSAHILPMTRVRRELGGKVGKYIGSGVTAARLKRMSSIRRKLRKEQFSLYSIQDIAGCRAVVSSVDNVRNLVNHYVSGDTKHKVVNNRDLISNPRRGGYRSHHLIVEFCGADVLAPWNKLKVEMQLRTKLQHAWATAVEAVGLMRGENLKAGEGDRDWLRLFALMSAEFCAEEDQPMVPGVPESSKERKSELRDLTRRLRALHTLESYNRAISHVGASFGGADRYVVVQFDYQAKTVSVRPFLKSSLGDAAYIGEETRHEETHAVLVEMSTLDDLREAYPNYFVDVTMFIDRLRSCVSVWDPAWAKL